jgi:hypothetical protein
MQIHTYDAEDIFESLNYCDQELNFNRLFEIRKQGRFEEAKEPKSDSKKSTVPVLKLTEGLDWLKLTIKVPEDNASAATSRQRTELACLL